MPRNRIRPSTLLALVAVAVLLSGCSAMTGPLSEQSERAVADDVADRIEQIDGFTATQVLETARNGTQATRMRVWVRPGSGERRTEILAPADRAGDVSVAGNGTYWHYDRSENTVTRTNVSTNHRPTGLTGSQLDDLVERYEMTYEGTVQLDGRETHKLRLTTDASTNGPAVDGTITMWVDADKRFPARLAYEFGEYSVTMRFENVTINPGISDDRFDFDPPEDASVQTSSVDYERFDSRSALAGATDRPVPSPDLPDGYQFETGTLLNGSYSLQYSNGSRRLLVTATDAGRTTADGGESITVAGRDGTVRELGDTTIVRWSCGDSAYSVTGDSSRAALQAVADSIGCP